MEENLRKQRAIVLGSAPRMLEVCACSIELPECHQSLGAVEAVERALRLAFDGAVEQPKVPLLLAAELRWIERVSVMLDCYAARHDAKSCAKD